MPEVSVAVNVTVLGVENRNGRVHASIVPLDDRSTCTTSVEVPHTFKLFLQEIKSMGIVARLMTQNDKPKYMTVTDRACWLLQHFGINMSENEYIGLRLTDGLYEEANKTYYMNWSKDNQLATNIAYILHQADMMASKIEYDEWARGDHDIKVEKEAEVQKKTEQSKKANQAFKELFG